MASTWMPPGQGGAQGPEQGETMMVKVRVGLWTTLGGRVSVGLGMGWGDVEEGEGRREEDEGRTNHTPNPTPQDLDRYTAVSIC